MTDGTAQAPVLDGEGGPVWRRIADDLMAAIEREDYRPGDTLPASTALADRYGVHRHTVRQAFRHLADLGLVTVSRGRGTQVGTPRVPYPIGRRVSMRSNMGKLGIVGTSRMLCAKTIRGEASACAALGLKAGAPLWRVRGVSLADGVPMGTSTHWLPVERFPAFDRAYRDAEGSITAAFKHYGIADYVRLSTRLTARLADEREAGLLEIAPASAVMVSSAIDALPDLTPIHLVSSVFAGARMEMVIEPFGDSPSPAHPGPAHDG
ncbi:phosphonate metabolism transcriptional regulator PhnF [Bosea sp. (in: a-proteobacteria)]|uniref:phosphonate metabolism transcriptional regulator PhnF n=1 Tax=Bosea sp. (in: a-proteobacteria) TaxID=1871050 RepID=UPI00263A3BA3|nr:phosphonate metabolism transcriptional regulator PhnF [Bosea sp. (in: a-proteobacteria)]MCO5089726.1 phosphonate metabolism transcriptional regulator PhnF [Bosea sp. (in: a-proteobacteria)]